MPVDFEAATRQCWEMAQRVGVQIAELPLKARDIAFAGAERCLRAAGSERGVVGRQLDCIVELQMGAIRQVVTDIDLSGSPKVGKA
jgi:hypothetical protein